MEIHNKIKRIRKTIDETAMLHAISEMKTKVNRSECAKISYGNGYFHFKQIKP
jgi:hypothetical protein